MRHTIFGVSWQRRRHGAAPRLLSLLLCLLAVLFGAAAYADSPPPFAVTATAGQATPNPAGVEQQMTAGLSATPNNPPQTTTETTVTGPNWGWQIVSVESSPDGFSFNAAQPTEYTANISQPDQTRPDATFTFTAHQAEYFRVRVQATATYHSDPGGDVSASGTTYVLGVGPAVPIPGGSGGGTTAAQAVTAHAAANAAPTPPTPGNGNLLVATQLQIWRNGQNVTNSTVSVWIGEGISLTAQVFPSDIAMLFYPSGIDPGIEYTWQIASGIAIGGFNQSDTAGGPVPVGYPLTGATTGTSFHLYWVGPQGIMASPTQVTMTDSDLPALSAATVNFTLKIPNASASSVMKAATLDLNFNPQQLQPPPNKPALHLGTPSSDNPHTTDGIILTASVDPSSGTYEWIQLDTGETGTITLLSGTVYAEVWNPNQYPLGQFPAADAPVPYANNSSLSSLTETSDSPGSPFLDSTWKSLSYSASFEDFLMFTPNTQDHCSVPLGTINWSWGGTVTNNPDAQNNPNWTSSALNPATPDTHPPFVVSGATPIIPSWANNISSLEYLPQH